MHPHSHMRIADANGYYPPTFSPLANLALDLPLFFLVYFQELFNVEREIEHLIGNHYLSEI
jgi:hypothetical protein